MTKKKCPNLNHSRVSAPVRFCPMCGEVVNIDIRFKICSDEEHAKRRKGMSKYCIDCGKQLIH